MVVIAFALFAVAWVAAFQWLGRQLNGLRAGLGADVHDGVTQFLSGWSTGPWAIMASFHPQTNTAFKGALMAGGLAGTLGAIMLFWILWT